MKTLTVELDERTLVWLREEGARTGKAPAEVAAAILTRHLGADELLALTTRMSETARTRGLTEEKLDELLGG